MSFPTLGKTPSWPVGKGRFYSCYNWQNATYDYYHDPFAASDGGGGWEIRPGPTNTRLISQIGDPLENCLRELPASAKYVGSGADPKGEIVVKNRQAALWGSRNVPRSAGLSGIGDSQTPPKDLIKWLLIGGAAFLVLGGWVKIKQAF